MNMVLSNINFFYLPSSVDCYLNFEKSINKPKFNEAENFINFDNVNSDGLYYKNKYIKY